jgi:hypothetical protein
MSAIGTKRTFQPHSRLSVIGVTADMSQSIRGSLNEFFQAEKYVIGATAPKPTFMH